MGLTSVNEGRFVLLMSCGDFAAYLYMMLEYSYFGNLVMILPLLVENRKGRRTDIGCLFAQKWFETVCRQCSFFRDMFNKDSNSEK